MCVSVISVVILVGMVCVYELAVLFTLCVSMVWFAVLLYCSLLALALQCKMCRVRSWKCGCKYDPIAQILLTYRDRKGK